MAKDSVRLQWMQGMGRRLEQELERLGLRAQELAAKLGRSPQIVSHWVVGHSEITGYDMARLATFGFDLDYVATGERSDPPRPGKCAFPRHIPLLKPNQILTFCEGKLVFSDLERTEPPFHDCSDLAFSFDVFDAAMLPHFKPGSTRVSVDPAIYPNRDSVVLVAMLASGDLLLERDWTCCGKPRTPDAQRRTT